MTAMIRGLGRSVSFTGKPTEADFKITISTSPGLTSQPFQTQTAHMGSQLEQMHEAGKGMLYLWTVTLILLSVPKLSQTHKKHI